MSEEAETAKGLLALWQEIGANIQVLGIAGLAGAFIKALIAPEEKWKSRAIQAIVGLFSAVFLGGLAGSMLEGFVTVPAYAYLATGFLFGTLGEIGIAWAQKKFLESKVPSTPSSRRDEDFSDYPDYEGDELPPRMDSPGSPPRVRRGDRPNSPPSRRR